MTLRRGDARAEARTKLGAAGWHPNDPEDGPAVVAADGCGGLVYQLACIPPQLLNDELKVRELVGQDASCMLVIYYDTRRTAESPIRISNRRRCATEHHHVGCKSSSGCCGGGQAGHAGGLQGSGGWSPEASLVAMISAQCIGRTVDATAFLQVLTCSFAAATTPDCK